MAKYASDPGGVFGWKMDWEQSAREHIYSPRRLSVLFVFFGKKEKVKSLSKITIFI